MTCHRFQRLAVSLALVLLAADPGSAAAGRDFIGFYRLENVTDAGDMVTATLIVRVHNYSEADVTNVVLVLGDSVYPDAVHSTIAAISIPARDRVRTSAAFMVPRREYEYWLRGGHPILRLEFTGEGGDTVRQSIELNAMIADEVE